MSLLCALLQGDIDESLESMGFDRFSDPCTT